MKRVEARPKLWWGWVAGQLPTFPLQLWQGGDKKTLLSRFSRFLQPLSI
jgi:hypothetical protein